MTVNIKTDGVTLDRPTKRYVNKCMAATERLLPRRVRDDAKASVLLKRVDRAHGNKYEVTVTIHAGDATYEAADSTLNVLAALDIVQVKIRTQLLA